MVEFLGEGLILDGAFRIHWLIWIQLLVFLLLLLLLYSLSSSASDDLILTASVDPPLSSTTAAATPSSSSSSFRRRQEKKLPEEDGNPDRRKDGVEIEREEAGSSLTEVAHPCHMVRLARMAFLKCFGLGGPPKGQPHL